MLRSILARAAFAAFVALSAVAVPAAAKEGSKAAPPDVQKSVTELEAAFNAHDAKKVGTLFTPEGSFINPPGQRATGRGEVVSRLTEDMEGPLKDATMQIRIETTRMLSPTLALLDLEHEVTGPNLPRSAPRPARAHGVAVMQKSGGKWLVSVLRVYFFLPPDHGAGAGAMGEPAQGAPAPAEPQQGGAAPAPTQR